MSKLVEWTPELISTVITLRQEGFPYKVIARKMGGQVTESAASSAYARYSKCISAEPVRIPTSAQNRAIVDLLESYYDVDRQMYLEDYTDEALAEQLNYPWTWVADLRARLYGPEDNEQAHKVDPMIATLREEGQKLAAQVQSWIEKVDTHVKAA